MVETFDLNVTEEVRMCLCEAGHREAADRIGGVWICTRTGTWSNLIVGGSFPEEAIRALYRAVNLVRERVCGDAR